MFLDDECLSIEVLDEIIYGPFLEDPTLTLLDCLLQFNNVFFINYVK
jgi:hypothetical protein